MFEDFLSSSANGSNAVTRDTASLSRGDLARLSLLKAALQEFGQLSLEGARIREIAKAAGQNLAAVSYHFGGKGGLYLALIDAISQYMRTRLDASMKGVHEFLDQGAGTPEEAIEQIRIVLDGLINAVIADESTLYPSLIVVREQMRPTEAFDLIYDRIVGPTHDAVTRLLAHAFGWDPEAESTIVRAHTLVGQIFVFRAGRETIMRRARWATIEEREAEIIRQAVHDNLEALATRHLVRALENTQGENSR